MLLTTTHPIVLGQRERRNTLHYENSKKTGHLPMEYPEPQRPRLMVKFALDPPKKPKVEPDVRLVFFEDFL